MPKNKKPELAEVTKEFEIFAAGSYPQGDFTQAELNEIAGSYNPDVHEAPQVLGHVSDHVGSTVPAGGWVKALKVVGDKLLAVGTFTDKLVSSITSGEFKKRSIGLYAPDDESNPTPGKWHLHHVAWLGGQPPQVKGLANVAFVELGDRAKILNFEFADIALADLQSAANEDTYASIETEFALCLSKIQDTLASDADDDDKKNKLGLAISDCYYALQKECDLHFAFLDKAESIASKPMDELREMVRKIKTFVQNKTGTSQSGKESVMDEKQKQEFAELQAKVKEQDAKILSFAEEKKALEAKATADAQAAEAQKKKDVETRVEGQLKEFREELVKAGYPVKKLEDEGVLALAKQLLTANELEFGEGKKKAPMEILKGLVEGTAKVNTGIEFSDDQELVNVADVIGVDRKLPVDAAGLRKIQFCEQHYQKHLEEFKGVDHKVALARILRDVQNGKIKYSGK
jgi:hypothetical protein